MTVTIGRRELLAALGARQQCGRSRRVRRPPQHRLLVTEGSGQPGTSSTSQPARAQWPRRLGL
jgi:hypothetical protein